MDYRDERDALRGRVENLEQDLAGAREQLAATTEDERARRVAELEQKAAEARRILDEVSSELARLQGPAKPPPPTGAGGKNGRMVVWIAVVVLGPPAIVAAVNHLHKPVRVAPPPIVEPVPVAAPPPPPPEPIPSAPPVVSSAPPTPPPPAQAEVTARWTAQVTRATGRARQAGSTCRIEATLRSGRSIGVQRLQVNCGGTAFHDSDDDLEGMSMSGSSVLEEAGDREGTSRYQMRYEDKGTRTGKRTEISLDTLSGTGAVWSDSMPAFRIELSVPHLSEPVEGAALLTSIAEAVRRKAMVREISGPAPLRAGATCALRLSPAGSGQCMVRLSCGGQMLYGKGMGGLGECTIEDRHIQRVVDREPTSVDKDPEIDVDVAAGAAVLADGVGRRRWTVTFGLDASL